nr:putative UPF0481 protein At3g02645 [Tanacetum cinerariifolium]
MENGDVELGNVIGKTVQLLLDCEEKGRKRKSLSQPSIHMVPTGFRNLSPSSFNPQVVAIGPLHKGDENLQEFEKRKEIYLHEFLVRLNLLPKKTLHACVEKVRGSINQIKACYTGIFDDTELAKMMVMDGCFILEFFCKLSEYKDIPLDTNPVNTRRIIDDLLRVENQIPFFVLKKVFECTILDFNPQASLTKLLLPFLVDFMKTILKTKPLNIDTGAVDTCYDHILGLLHKSYQPSYRSELFMLPNFHSATELDRAGVNFMPNDAATSLTAIKLNISGFRRKRTLKMPVVCITDSTEMVLRNLIAYEQSSPLIPNYITSYAYAMHMLIHTPDDVAKLVESKVIVNFLASNERAANILKNICKETIIVDFFYQDEWKKLHEYYNGYWPKQIAGLKRTYFSNPWSMISLFAGIVLFILTLVQTIFTVRSACN